jgi:hypothetical protein
MFYNTSATLDQEEERGGGGRLKGGGGDQHSTRKCSCDERGGLLCCFKVMNRKYIRKKLGYINNILSVRQKYSSNIQTFP